MYGPEGRPPNVSQARESLCENSTYPRGWENPVPHFPWAAAANEKRHIDSHYPTQAKGRLEWGTQHFFAGVANTMATMAHSLDSLPDRPVLTQGRLARTYPIPRMMGALWARH
jgi:hypothetical protein